MEMSSKKPSAKNPDLMAFLARRARNFALAACAIVLALAADTLAAAGLAGKIAYVCGGNICLFDLAAGTNTPLPVSGVNPKISPDGTRIAFQSSGIHVMNA